jgi:hypothetical protein
MPPALGPCRTPPVPAQAWSVKQMTAAAPTATGQRPAVQPGDFESVSAMHAHMSPDNRYLRFFSLSPQAPEHEASRICRPAAKDH